MSFTTNTAQRAVNERKKMQQHVGIVGHCESHFAPQVADLGEIAVVHHVKSSLGPFNTFPGHHVRYPEVVVKALGQLYGEYNRAFGPLIEPGREHATDYQYCVTENDLPLNRWVQIDMRALPQDFLDLAPALGVDTVREFLRKHTVYEIENSLAMYHLLSDLFPDAPFKAAFRASLDRVRLWHGKNIALLAVTKEKYDAMMESEFGKKSSDTITDKEVAELSGFDHLFGPEDFRRYVEANGGECDYLLYVRASDPESKQKNPRIQVEHPLLNDPNMRRIIRASTLTFNVDNPQGSTERMINDTKGYMPRMSLAYLVNSMADVLNASATEHLRRGLPLSTHEGLCLTEPLVEFLRGRGVDEDLITTGRVHVLGKPLLGTYGCYGHCHGDLHNRDFRDKLKKGLRDRPGGYVIQPFMPALRLRDGIGAYDAIDRNFLAMGRDGEVTFMGGFRSFMPLETAEAAKGRVHGNKDTVWAPITL